MPYSSIEDVPPRVKSFWKNIGATDAQKRQWIHVFNSCYERYSDDGRCFRMANGVVGKSKNNMNVEFLAASLQADGGKFVLQDVKTPYGNMKQIPVRLTKEGVMNGFFKDWEELKATYWSFNFIPVTDGHPFNELGFGIPAKSNPEVIRGFISDVSPQDEIKTLVGKLNIFDEPRNQYLIKEIQEGTKADGSIGFFSDEVEAHGKYGDREYVALEINILGDHYALLPAGHGACSQDYGCGLGLNEGGKKLPEGELDVSKELLGLGLSDEEVKSLESEFDTFRKYFSAMDCVRESYGYTGIGFSDASYTNTPPWGSVDKTKLPASAFMYVGDPELKSTWKLPYKTASGAIHCGAIRAIKAVLGGARGGVSIPGEARAKAVSLANRHWAACQKGRDMADELFFNKANVPWKYEIHSNSEENKMEKVLYIDINLEKLINMADNPPANPPPSEDKQKEFDEKIKLMTEKIDSLTKERDAFAKKSEELEGVVKMHAEEKAKAEKEAFESRRTKVMELNFRHRVYTEKQILDMDAANLSIAESMFDYLEHKNTDFRGAQTPPEKPIQLPSGYAPLSVGNLKKNSSPKKEG